LTGGASWLLPRVAISDEKLIMLGTMVASPSATHPS
jgi:hypothetical protein